MQTIKIDPRIAKTLQKLRDALFNLLAKIPLAKISVEKILDVAAVTRATFYAHFKNKNDFVQRSFDAIITDFMEYSLVPADYNFKRRFDLNEDAPVMRLNLSRAFNFIGAHKNAFDVMFRQPDFYVLKNQFINQLGENISRFNQALGGRLSDASRPEDIQKIMIISPFVSIVEKWISEPTLEQPSYMARLFASSLRIDNYHQLDLTIYFDTTITDTMPSLA